MEKVTGKVPVFKGNAYKVFPNNKETSKNEK